ncbi:MAG: STAS domain-containing protein [Melioribacteraceae bacterium]
MILKDELNDSIAILSVDGKIDATNSQEFELHIKKLIENGKHKILVNMELCPYVSSAALRVFIVAAKNLKHLSGELVFAVMCKQVTDVFEISGFSRLFKIFQTELDAQNYFVQK